MNTLLPGFNVAMGGWSSGCSRHRLTTFNTRSPRDRSTVPTGFRRQPDSTGPTRRLDAIDCTRQNMPNVQVRRWSNWENPTKKDRSMMLCSMMLFRVLYPTKASMQLRLASAMSKLQHLPSDQLAACWFVPGELSAPWSASHQPISEAPCIDPTCSLPRLQSPVVWPDPSRAQSTSLLCTFVPTHLPLKPKSPSFLRRLTLRLHLLFCSRVPGFILHNQGQSPDCSHDVHVLSRRARAQHRPAIPLSIDAGADVVVQSAAAQLRARVLWVPRIRPAFPIPTSPASSTSTRPSLSHVAVCHSGSKPFAIVCPHRYTWNLLLLPLNLTPLFFLSSLLISFKPVAAKYCPVVRPCRPMRKVLDL